MRVVAVVVTYNRKDLLLECLAALARQTRRPDRVLLVDNASTDRTREAVETSAIADRLPLEHMRLARNGGGSEGFHFGVREALREGSDWIWLMDDDCEPADDALQRLLESPHAGEPDTAALVPAVRLPTGEPLPMHRGWITARPFRAPMRALDPATYAGADVPCDFASFVGPLFRTTAIRAAGLPLRPAFIRFEDLEFSARIRAHGLMWLVGGAVVAHKEGVPVTGTDVRTLWRDFSIHAAFKDQWKNVYGLRNVIYAGRRHGFVSAASALSYVAVQMARAVAFDERKLRTAWLIGLYASDGWRGRFRNVPPPRWPALATARDPVGYLRTASLRYDEEMGESVTPFPVAAARPTPAE